MFPSFVFRCLCFWQLVGVFADSGTVKSVSVMEGYPVTLQSGLTQIQENDLIYWYSEDSGILIAHINKEAGHFNISDGRLKDRLELDHQTGSLTIMNINIKDSGLYNVTIKRNNVTNHRFNVTVYALISAAAVGCVLVVAAVGVFWIYRRHRKTKVETDPPRNEEITYADPTFYNQKAKKPKVKQEEEVVYAGVVMQT
ncbi:uncharacterized protein LOC122327450 isoform X4 [Puntigrus tetrazona]|uniref:uncharacterized protein LOC122327450 isoform X4 n=1 Tax=Puntigrus tetrazona TaxID=1606681 RepID=UPI001C895FC5|nr:uncharacterized protein LOC122327450 isoform X4 [Puntigrus tetrazona]